MQNLVIVESPTKARTLSRFLGDKYQIEASMGHIRDLPKSKLGIDVDHNFEPEYIIPRDKRKKVNELKKIAKGAKDIWLATDPDREGEAIAWHLAQLVGSRELGDRSKKSKTNPEPRTPNPEPKRVVFHEITEDAIKKAFDSPRAINLQLVDAQQARRVLDRLVGYKLSPVLWQKIKRGLSAGRVQSVALRLIVEREREIEAFKPVEYWTIEVEVEPADKKDRTTFFINLIEINGKKAEINNKDQAEKLVTELDKAEYKVSAITKKEVKRHPAPPFITSTLQQTAGNKLGMSAKKTMMLAQNLYEHGLITYMRTDSVMLSSFAIQTTREYIVQNFGKSYLPVQARVYKSKSKNAQEAHEAIRPTNIRYQMSDIRNQKGFNKDHVRLYDLIWKRTLASQMIEAVFNQTTVDAEARVGSLESGVGSDKINKSPNHELQVKRTPNYLLRATGSILKFDGWLKIYGVTQIEDQEDEDKRKQILPQLSEGETLNKLQVLPDQHFTEPPPRYNEASLIKKLEELGIGRPSTYAPILSTIQERFYVEKLERRFIPTPLGASVSDFLVKYFPKIVDYEFTAQMEDQLDEISRGERPWKETISEFYKPFEEKVEETAQKAKRVKLALEMTDQVCPVCGKNLVVRTGRFGKFLACSGFPDCKYTAGLEEKINVKCPQDGGEIVVRKTKKGKTFYGCKNYPACKFASWTKPKG